MTNYQKGVRLEYKIRDYLRSKGFLVIRSAGSKSAVDLIAVENNSSRSIQGHVPKILLIQAKAGRLTDRRRTQIRLELINFTGRYTAECCVITNDFGRELDSIS